MKTTTGFSCVMYRSAFAIPFPASNIMSYSRDRIRTEHVFPAAVSYHPLVPRNVTCIDTVFVTGRTKTDHLVFGKGELVFRFRTAVFLFHCAKKEINRKIPGGSIQ